MLKSFSQALAYEAFYQIIAGQHLAAGLILPRQHFLNAKFASVLTVEQAILLFIHSKHMDVVRLPGAQNVQPTGFGQ